MYKFLIRNKVLIIVLFFVAVRFFHVCLYTSAACIKEKNYGKAAAGDTANPVFKYIEKFRNNSVQKVRKLYPSPHSELLLGVVLGIDELSTVPTFNDILIATGTIHVVVVSGYNINLLFSFVKSVLGGIYTYKKFFTAVIATLIYSVIAGFEPPVIRAWIMSSISGLGMLYGRKLDPIMLLIFSGAIMLFFNPELLFSLSFQLSFLASLSLLMFSPMVKPVFASVGGQTKSKKQACRPQKAVSASFFQEDLVSSFSAQILVWPVISGSFGRVSIFSPFINAVVLWTIPLSTVLGAIFLLFAYINQYLAVVLSLVLYAPLDIFIQVLRLFSNIPFLSINFSLGTPALLIYYSAVLVFYFLYAKPKSVTTAERKYSA